MWFQQDGAPAHNSRVAREYLDTHFAPRLITTSGPVRWPARSPDLTPLDFFLWGYVKNQVYRNEFENIDELQNSVVEFITRINQNSVRKAANHVLKRIQLCVQNNGAHIENYN